MNLVLAEVRPKNLRDSLSQMGIHFPITKLNSRKQAT